MTFCPSCGFNLSRDKTVERDGFVIDPRGSVTFLGRVVPLRSIQIAIMHSIASQGERTAPTEAIAGRIGSEALDLKGLMQTQICGMRKRFALADVPCPIRTVHGRGYRWECLV